MEAGIRTVDSEKSLKIKGIGLHQPKVYSPFSPTSHWSTTPYMRHGSCSNQQLPRRIPGAAQFWR